MPDCDQEMNLVGGKTTSWAPAKNGPVAATNGTALLPSRKIPEDTMAAKDAIAPCRVSRDSFLGRHLVATRDIKAGEVVLQETPLVSGPAQNHPPCCVACYKPLNAAQSTPSAPGAPGNQGTSVECPKGCGWPVCSETCADAAAHWPECDITRNKRGEKVVVDKWGAPSQLFDSLIVLRCLSFRDSNPEVWAKLTGLESHCSKRKETGRYEQDRVAVAHFIRDYFKLEETFSEEEVLRICGAIQINGYGVRLTEPCYCAVYDTLSFVEHHCVPNCSKSWSSSGALTVRAVVDVPRDAHLSICYTDPLWGTQARRQHLAHELLGCRCDRCADPTEYGTYYSAVRCINARCGGYLLPVDPLALQCDANVGPSAAGPSPWRCEACDHVMAPEQVSAILSRVKAALDATSKSDAGALATLLEEGKQVLHTNHFYLTEIRIALAQEIGKDKRALQELSETDLQFKMALCWDVLQLADVLLKGVNRVTGVIRYELHKSLLEDARRKSKRGEVDDAAINTQMREARLLLVEATSILSYEPEVLPEGKVALQALKSLEELQAAFQDISLRSSSEQ